MEIHSQLSLRYFLGHCRKIHVWVRKNHGSILSNVFFDKYCGLNSPVLNCEPKVKVLKESLKFWCNVQWNFYILSILCFVCYCAHIFTVYINSLYFNVYSKTMFIYLHMFIHFWLLSFYTLFFYKHGVFYGQRQYFFFSASNQASDKLKVWYYFMILKMTQRWVEGMFLWERLCLWEWRIFQLIYRLCL